MARRGKGVLLALVTAVTLAACGGAYQRGIFQGYVIDSTEDEITGKIGKPEQIDASDPMAPKWIYTKKTFDPDNMNKTDDKTIVVLRRNPTSGKLVGAQVVFM